MKPLSWLILFLFHIYGVVLNKTPTTKYEKEHKLNKKKIKIHKNVSLVVAFFTGKNERKKE